MTAGSPFSVGEPAVVASVQRHPYSSCPPRPYYARFVHELSRTAAVALAQASERLTERCLDRVASTLPWYRTLPAAAREQIATVARVGVGMFVDSLGTTESPAPPAETAPARSSSPKRRPAPTTSIPDPTGPPAGSTTHPASRRPRRPEEIFTVAPPSLTSVLTLDQTLTLVRTVVDVVAEQAPALLPPEARESDREAVTVLALTFGRDVGFAAASVYAQAAEARGAWGARLETIAVEALLDEGGSRRSPGSGQAMGRMRTAGWSGDGPVQALAAACHLDAAGIATLRRRCRRLAADSLVSVRGDMVLVVLGAESDAHLADAVTGLIPLLEGPAVLGHAVAGPAQAGVSLRGAVAGLQALPARPEAPCPCPSDDLLPERLLTGDPLAAGRLRELVQAPVEEMGEPFGQTVAAYLETGRSLEAAARRLTVHANTVRYRLGRVAEVTGWDPADPRDGLVLHLALLMARVSAKEVA